MTDSRLALSPAFRGWGEIAEALAEGSTCLWVGLDAKPKTKTKHVAIFG